MKVLLFFAVLLAGIWLWRHRSDPIQRAELPKTPDTLAPLNMVCCSHCGVHIPGDEVLAGTHGSYCSLDHLHQSES